MKRCSSIEILFKMDITAKRQCFVTIKDHKDYFRVNPKYRLLNPTKNELGKISKHILQQVSTNIRRVLNVNQWQNSSEVIKWFKNIKNKNLHTFTVFDITHQLVRNFLKTQFYLDELMQTSVGRILK